MPDTALSSRYDFVFDAATFALLTSPLTKIVAVEYEFKRAAGLTVMLPQDRDGDGEPQFPEGPYDYYGVASCCPSCGLGKQQDIYEEAMADEAYIAHLVKEREEAAFDEHVEYLVEQREKEKEAITDIAPVEVSA